MIGIDVDAYDGKQGAATFARLQELHGELPPTARSTSRSDGISGIRLYRIPAGKRWPGVLSAKHADGRITSDIEVIHQGNRYVVCSPSVHPGKRTYKWLDDDDQVLVRLPLRDQIPDLPTAWIEALQRDAVAPAARSAHMPHEQVQAWLQELPGGEPCQQVTHARNLVTDAASGGSRHDGVRDALLHLFGSRRAWPPRCRRSPAAVPGRVPSIGDDTRRTSHRFRSDRAAQPSRRVRGMGSHGDRRRQTRHEQWWDGQA